MILSLFACVQPVTLEEEADTTPLDVGDERVVQLRALTLEVEGFEQTLNLEGLQDLPDSALDVWLLDLPLLGLVENSLTSLADMPADEAQDLPQAAQNMRELLRTTPDNAVLDDTSLEELLSLAAVLGLPPARPLADILQVGVTERIIPPDVAAQVVLEGLVGSHPLTRERVGPVDDAHPDGIWEVTPNSLPITLKDVVTNFEDLPDRFGPAETEWGLHPGFVKEAEGISVIEDEFEMSVKVNANALPFQALDLTGAEVGAVNSTGSQIDALFATEDPDWLSIEGMVAEPTIEHVAVEIFESDLFHPPGGTREPLPYGANTAWDLEPWIGERLIAGMAHAVVSELDATRVTLELGTGTTVFEGVLDDTGWMTFETFTGVGNPPDPAYLWDLELELAQVRLHDGGLAEGDADVLFTLEDVGLGVKSAEIIEDVAANLAADPGALKELATAITENGRGAPDLYYRREGPDADDVLVFVAEGDLTGERTYDYANPGFFADEGLTERVGEVVGGHEEVIVSAGDRLYVEDDVGALYELVIADKPSTFRIAVEVTRLR